MIGQNNFIDIRRNSHPQSHLTSSLFARKMKFTVIAGIICYSVILMFFFINSRGEKIMRRFQPIATSTSHLNPNDGTQKEKKQRKKSALVTSHPIQTPFRVFPKWDKSFPCYGEAPNGEKHRGILYIKTYKAASSTLAGVAMRIGELKQRKEETTKKKKCFVNAHHNAASALGYSNRDKRKSFLWTFIRDPSHRAVSSFFYFEVSLKKHNPTGTSLLSYLKSQTNFQTNYLRTLDEASYDMNSVNKTAMAILKEYDFVGLVEFLDESLVIMRLLLGLDAKDILYLPAKQMGSFGVLNSEECTRIYQKFTTPEVDKYLASREWRTENKVDYALIEVAKRSLQATIQSIGQDKFEEALKEHKKLLAEAQSKCIDSNTYPCSEEGVRQKSSCYWNDIGCGHKCIDNL